MKIRKPKMNEQSYEKIKYLLSIGLTNTQIEKIMKTSNGTIVRVRDSKNMAEYRVSAKEAYLANKMKYRTPSKPIVTSGVNLPTPEKKPSKTPVYDVMVEIRDEIRILNAYIKANGKSKGWKLF